MTFQISILRSLSRFRNHNPFLVTTSLLIRPARSFSVNTTLFHKMFKEHENKYAFDIMRSKGYAVDIELNKEKTVLNKGTFQELLQEKWIKKQPSEIFEAYTKISAYCSENDICISNTMFDNFIDDLTDNISKATDSELVSIFYALTMWPETKSIRTRNLIEVWAALDDACLQRVNQWSPSETLSFIALFYMLNVSRVSDFCTKGLNKLASKAKSLTSEQIVQTLFFVGIQRQSPYDMHNLEVQMFNTFSEYTIDEIAIMSMGFFKSKTPIRNQELNVNIANKILENHKNVHEVTLAALLKILRYSMMLPLPDGGGVVNQLLEVLQHEVPRLSVMCNVHLALLGMSKLILHRQCLDAIAKKTLENVSNTRLKDLERLVLTFGTLSYKPQTEKDLFEAIINELRRSERHLEIQTHGKAFACCIAYLGLLESFPTDLINKVLSKEFLKNTYGKSAFTYGKEILVLNNLAQIFCNKHEMNFLTQHETLMLAKKYTDYMPSEDFKKQYNITEKVILDIIKILEQSRGGKEYVVGDHILPHHQRGDLILCNDPVGKPLPIPTNSFSKFGLIQRPPDGNKWIVLVVAGRNGAITGSDESTGPFKIKLKELQTLGYHSNLVLWNTYTNLKSVAEKTDYLNKLICDAVPTASHSK